MGSWGQSAMGCVRSNFANSCDDCFRAGSGHGAIGELALAPLDSRWFHRPCGQGEALLAFPAWVRGASQDILTFSNIPKSPHFRRKPLIHLHFFSVRPMRHAGEIRLLRYLCPSGDGVFCFRRQLLASSYPEGPRRDVKLSVGTRCPRVRPVVGQNVVFLKDFEGCFSVW